MSKLILACIAAQPRHALVTHGMDSMVQTGHVLASVADNTIVMAGALSPARFCGSDAAFDIGCAIGAVHSLPSGAYTGMNGRIRDPAKARKIVAANRLKAA